MTVEITMPQLGETVTEGTITRWAKKVGDRVEEDEVLFEVSTDKVDSEVPSPAAGVLVEILVQEGETADVGARLAVIGDAQEADGDGAGTTPEAEPAEAGTGQESPAAATTEPEDAASPDAAAEAAVAGEEEVPGQEKGASATAEDGQGQGGRSGGSQRSEAGSSGGGSPAPQPADGQPEDGRDGGPPPQKRQPQQSGSEAEPAVASWAPEAGGGGEGGGAGASRSPGGQSKVLSPVVRRLIAEHGLDPDQISASGAGGRITRADVLAVIDSRGAGGPAREAAVAAPAGGNGSRSAKVAAPRPGGDEVVRFSNIRRRTAEHMRRSLDTSAHTLVVIEVDYDGVERARLPARARFKEQEGVSLSYLPFIARAVVDAIHEFPNVNASVGDDELVIHHYVNLGVAVDLNHEGLIVPVVHDADDKRLRALAREIADLAGRARSKKLGADDISGGTFTITNPGGYGTFLTAPIINQPQVAILSTDGVKPKPVAVALPGGGYGVAVHPVGNLAIAFDHRAFDGAYASAFLARLREILETRDWSQELA